MRAFLCIIMLIQINKVLITFIGIGRIKLNNNFYDVSVIMATFNPVWNKCIFTLKSIIKQKNIKLELIVVDDGSSDALFDKYRYFFEVNNFSDFILIGHETNQGTVRNYYKGLQEASGKYIKLISPGDALYNENTLSDWVDRLEESGRRWSFAESVYYSEINNSVKLIKGKAAPRLIECYKKDAFDVCRWNYVVLEDIPLGASILCDRLLFSEYLVEIIDKVIYAEDLTFMLIMYDGIRPYYYPESCIIYEFGRGVSTSVEKKWQGLFRADLASAEHIITKMTSVDDFQVKIKKSLLNMLSGSEKRKRIIKNTRKGGLKKVLRYRMCPRMTSCNITAIGSWWKEYERH